MPVALQAHNSNAPVGRAVRVVTDNEQELVLEFQFNMETQRGREAYSDAAGGFVPEWSVGFWVRSSESVTIDGERYDRFTDIDLDEVSLVYSGAVPGTETLAVRSQPQPLEAATQQAIAAFDDLLARFAERRESREREGRTLSDSQTSALKDLARRADALAQIEEPMPQPDNLARLDRELELRRKRITNK
jgi:HK97 family phage prohead protease